MKMGPPMASLIEGLRVWSDHQAKHLPFLRIKTQRQVDDDASETLSDKTILFIEPRCHPATEFVLRNLRYFCSWPILIVHGTENESFMRTIASKIKGSFSFLNIGVADLPNPAYNTLFTSPAFWSHIEAEYIFITQTDTMLMRHADASLQEAIDKNLAFLGAPWNYTCTACQAPLDLGCGHMIDQRVVSSLGPDMIGNGGFCLRKKSLMLEALKRWKLDVAQPVAEVASVWPHASGTVKQEGCTNEDVFYNKCFSILKQEGLDINLASREQGIAFAIEQIGPWVWPKRGAVALGCHKPWVYLPPNLTRAILERTEY